MLSISGLLGSGNVLGFHGQDFMKPTIIIISACLFAGCTYPEMQMTPNLETKRDLSEEDRKMKRTIQVFFDGTANQWSTRTNVRRRFEVAAAAEDPAAPCLYVDGVGNDSLSGKILGRGMKSRVLAGYKFIARQWRDQGDEIRVFGFSRGAFQARVMVGLMAHCGVPDSGNLDEREFDKVLDDIWDHCRRYHLDAKDGSSPDVWSKNLADNQRDVQKFICSKYNGANIRFRHPRVRFVGLWDTVPGLQFTKIKDDTTMAAKDSGQRYKVRPYPNVDIMAHALALDERRKQFRPLLLGQALDTSRTTVYEVWFPGAHSDIGGGYDDSNDMAGTTFNWMDSIMKKHNVTTRTTAVYADANGIQHHPEEVFPVNVGGRFVRRLPLGSMIDKTVFTRAKQDSVPNRMSGRNSGGNQASWKSYRPVIPLQDGGEIRIGVAKTPEARIEMLNGKLRLNDSESSPASQKALSGKPLNMDQMFAAPLVEPPVPVPAQADPAAARSGR